MADQPSTADAVLAWGIYMAWETVVKRIARFWRRATHG